MTRLIEFLISLAIVAALFLIVGLILPSHRHLVEKIETNRKQTIVFDTLNSLRRFDDWNPLVLRDPRMKANLSGPDSGVGASFDYVSKESRLGEGSWKIVESVPKEKIVYALTNPQSGSDKQMTFELKRTGKSGRNVEITQTYDVDYGWNLIGRYAGLYVSRHVGDDMKMGLTRLTGMLASVPNVDYGQEGSKMVDLKIAERPLENLLVVSAGTIPRNTAQIQGSMKSNVEWIRRVMEANDLSAAGPMRIVSTELGREDYTFDVVQPVRRGSAPAAATADGAASTSTPVATPVAASDAPLKVNLQGPVKYVQNPPASVATASYTGYMAELETVRNALRAWALTQGYEVDRPYESYKSGIDASFTEDGKFDVYWTLKSK